MPVTLAQIQETELPDIDYNNIDETRRRSPLLDLLTFEDSVLPDTAGGSLERSYTRTKTHRPAHTRQENTEYPAFEATKEKVSTSLVPMGARYNLDRVYARLGGASVNQLQFQADEARTSTIQKFHDLFINGVAADFSEPVPEFDGLDAIVTGTSTESLGPGDTPWDFDTITDKAGAMAAKRALNRWISSFDARPTLLFVNKEGQEWLEQIGDWIGYYTETSDTFGQTVTNFKGIPFLDLGDKDGSAEPVISTSDDGVTSIYAARLGLDAVHAYSVNGSQVLQEWLPDYTVAGAVKPGEIELGPVAIAAKRTKAVGAFRVKVSA